MTATLTRDRRSEPTVPPRRARRVSEPAVLGCLVVVVAGAAWAGWLAAPRPPGAGSPEVGFARDMGRHHAQAVEMAELVRERTTDPEIRTFAVDVALTQQAQIGQMGGWLDAWGVRRTSTGPTMAWMGHPTTEPMPGMAMTTTVAALRAANGGEADRLFLQAMIPHHRGGVLMARAVLARTDRPEVRRLAQAIVDGQRAEIAAMEDMLLRRGESPVTAAVTMPPGEEGHHAGGFTGAVGDTGQSTLRVLPLAAAVVALAWLVADTVAGRAPTGRGGRTRRWVTVGASGLAAAGLLHLGLAPEHFEVATSYGAFFVAAAVAELAVAAALAATARPQVALTGAAVAGFLIVVYLVFRVVAPPGADHPEAVELVGLLTQASQAAAVVAGVQVSRPRRAAGSA